MYAAEDPMPPPAVGTPVGRALASGRRDPAVKTTEMSLVSIVVPCYNAAKTLRACLSSAFDQTYRPIEVIVVDDASTDDSARIAAEFPCRLVRRPVNAGVSAARNLGAARSTGEILFFLDSDVGLAPDAVANAVALLRADAGCGLVFGVYDKEPLIDDGPVETCRTLHLHSVLTRAVGVTSTAVFALAALPRTVFDEIGPFDGNLRAGEDDDYAERLLSRYRIRLADTVVGRHDEADRLLPLLGEQFRRGQLLPFVVRNRMRPDGVKVNRAAGVFAAALTALSLPFVAAVPQLAVAPAALLAVFALADPPLLRFVVRERGAAFALYFLAVHFLVSLALVTGAAVGWLRSVIDPGFKRPRRAS